MYEIFFLEKIHVTDDDAESVDSNEESTTSRQRSKHMRLTDFLISDGSGPSKNVPDSSKMDFLCDMVKKIHDTVTSKVTR